MNTIYNFILLLWEIITSTFSTAISPEAQKMYPFIAFGMLLGAICGLTNSPKFKR